jgi:hypothetical protein
MKRAAPLAALLLALPLSAAAAEPPLAVVIGSNASPSATLDRLRYADDDAIQNARTLALLGARPRLLVTPDAETRELFPEARPDGPATLAAVVAAFEALARQAAAARARGTAARLYIFIAAHGDTEGNRPFLQLEDGRLWRDDLAALARRVDAAQTDVIIDACHASLFVGSRGPGGGERAPLGAGFSQRAGGPTWPARTGFFTARSSGGQTHEWTEYQAGIFSHEVRSGLLGGADIDLDGRVTYRELGAFVNRANQEIPNRKYRPEVLTSPPDGALDTVLATLPAGPLLLEIGGAAAGRASVESERGVRLADLHVAPGAAVHLRLPVDLGAVFVSRARPPAEYHLPAAPGRVVLAQLTPETPRTRPRGAAHEAFRRLYALPFDAAAVADFRAGADLVLAETPPPAAARIPRWAAWVSIAAGTAALVVAGGLALSAQELRSSAGSETDGVEIDRLNRGIATRNRLGIATGAAGGALVLGGLGLLWWQGRF